MKHIVIDSETTGLEPGSRLVELSAILLDDEGNEAARFDQLINPGMPLPPDVIAVHGLTNDDLAGSPSAKDALCQLLDWIDANAEAEEVTAIAHFAPYDVGIISWELGRAGICPPDFHVIDTCAMAREIKATKANNLIALVEHYAIEREGTAHRARSDADACRKYFNIARKLTTPIATPWAPEYTYTTALPGVLAKLPELVAAGGTLEFGYVDAKGARTDRAITPYGWSMQPKGLYFHGLCHARGERRTFKADGIVL